MDLASLAPSPYCPLLHTDRLDPFKWEKVMLDISGHARPESGDRCVLPVFARVFPLHLPSAREKVRASRTFLIVHQYTARHPNVFLPKLNRRSHPSMNLPQTLVIHAFTTHGPSHSKRRRNLSQPVLPFITYTLCPGTAKKPSLLTYPHCSRTSQTASHHSEH